MNKKLLVAAVSAAVMAPVAAQAAPEVTLYGRIHQSIELKSTDTSTGASETITIAADEPVQAGDYDVFKVGSNADLVENTDRVQRASIGNVPQGTTNFSSISSRWGIKATSNLGNGMTASAQYEFGVGTSERSQVTVGADKIDNNVSLRVAKVQLDGDFGSIAVGNQWSAYYNSVGAHMDPSYQIGSIAYEGVGGAFRTGNTIKYTTASGGPVVVEFDVRREENNVGKTENGLGIGLNADLSMLLNGLSFSAGIDNTTETASTTAPKIKTDLMGLAARYDLGSVFVSLSYNERDFKQDDLGLDADTLVLNNSGAIASGAKDILGKLEGTQIWLGTDFGESSHVMIGFGKLDYALDNDAFTNDTGDAIGLGQSISTSSTAVGFYYNVGGGLNFLYEGRADSHDGDTSMLNALELHDSTTHNLGVRLDF